MTVLANRTALVTGGSRGIGRAVAISLARAGAAVAIGYREKVTEAQNVVEAIRGNNPDEKVVVTEAVVVYVNVGDDHKPADIKRAANAYSD